MEMQARAHIDNNEAGTDERQRERRRKVSKYKASKTYVTAAAAARDGFLTRKTIRNSASFELTFALHQLPQGRQQSANHSFLLKSSDLLFQSPDSLQHMVPETWEQQQQQQQCHTQSKNNYTKIAHKSKKGDQICSSMHTHKCNHKDQEEHSSEKKQGEWEEEHAQST